MLLWLPGLRRRLFVVTLVAASTLLPASGPASAGEPNLFTVNLLTDEPDANPGDGTCDVSADTAQADCTLRAAFQEANAGGLPVTIQFDFDDLPAVISPESALPELSVPTLVDASGLATNDGPGVVIDGSAAGDADGLVFASGSTGAAQALGDLPTNGAVALAVIRFQGHGVIFRGADAHLVDSVIGSLEDEAAGNGGFGVHLDDADDVRMSGNIIGHSGNDGVHIDGAANASIGVPKGNTIVHNQGHGIVVSSSTQVTVENNRIGWYLDGSDAVAAGNQADGLHVSDSTLVSASANGVGSGNAIAGNTGHGIALRGTSSVWIRGNSIGVVGDERAELPNGGAGISIGSSTAADATETTIGGMLHEENVIAANAGAGIEISASTQHQVFGNSIYGNGGLGIDLGDPGITPNDLHDPDVGANLLQNFPHLSSATIDGDEVVVEGYLQSLANQDSIISVYASATCDPSGHGEGARIVGQAVVHSNEFGDAQIQLSLPSEEVSGTVLTATAISNGNTSEFSACLSVAGPAPGDVSITIHEDRDPLFLQAENTYLLRVHNAGPGVASGVEVEVLVPSAFTFNSSWGAPCVDSPSGPDRLVDCSLGTLDPGATREVLIYVMPQPGNAAHGQTVEVSALVSHEGADPNPGNNSAIESTTFTNQPTEVSVAVQPPPPALRVVGDEVTFTVTITNLGPQQATSVRVSSSTFTNNALLVSATSDQGQCEDDFPVICEMDDLGVGQHGTITFVARLLISGDTLIRSCVIFSPGGNNTQDDCGEVSASAEPTTWPLYEGWNQIELIAPFTYDTPDAIIVYLSAFVDPNVWMAVARYDEDVWLLTFPNPPIPAFNTLQRMEPGDQLWLYTSSDAQLSSY